MTKPVIVTRLGKGSELTFQEGDDNFTNLRDATVTVAGDTGSVINELNGSMTVAGGTGLTTSVAGSTLTVNLDNTAVTAGTYTNADITVDAQGRVTSAANGAPGYDDADARAAISVTDAGGEGSLSYASSTGVITYTGPDLSGYQLTSAKNQINGYAGLDENGKVAAAQLPSYVDDVIEVANYAALPVTGETSKIYVTLDINKTFRWSGTAYVEIAASPGTTDNVPEGTTNLYFSNTRARSAVSAGAGLNYDSSLGEFKITTSGLPTSSTGSVTATNGDTDYITVTGLAGIMTGYSITFTGAGLAGTGIMSGSPYFIGMTDFGNNAFQITQTMGGSVVDLNTVTGITGVTYTVGGGATGSYKLTYSGGGVTWSQETTPTSPMLSSLSDVSVMVPVTNGDILRYDSMDSRWKNVALPAGGIASVSADTTPSLGGNLNVNGNQIVSVSNGNIVIAPNGTGMTMLNNIEYNEKIHSLGTTAGTIAPDVANGNVQTITLNGNLTLNAFTNPIAGQSLTLIVNTGGTGRTLTSTMKFAGGTKTISTTSTTDIISIFYDGANYWASLSTDFK